MKNKQKEEPFTTGSGNIFVDFGFSEEEAAELSIKACLFRKLQDALKSSKLSQSQLAEQLGVKQPHISELMNGRMSGFSTERIAKYLLRLNYDISIDAQPSRSKGTGRVLEMKKKKFA